MADTPVSEIAGIVEQARESFASRKTLDVAFRKKQVSLTFDPILNSVILLVASMHTNGIRK